MLLELYKCVQLNRCSVVCGCVLQRGERVRRVSLGRESSHGEISGANCCMRLLWLRCRRCVCTMLKCICVEFAVICCCVTVFECVSMLVV